jgi:hypothetical protein
MIDDKGRVLGLINLIDLGVALLVVVAGALGVQAYRIFQMPTPVIERVEPSTLSTSGPLRVRIVGRHFRHYLRVFAPRTGQPFAVTPTRPEGPEAPVETVTDTSLDVVLPNAAPGSYDVYVYDNARQLAHLTSAVTLAAPDLPRATLQLTVRTLIAPEVAGRLHVGDRDGVQPGATGAALEPAEIAELTVRPERVDVMDMRVARQIPGDHYLWMGTHGSQVIADAVLNVPVVAQTPGVWEYRGRTVRAGESFEFETSSVKFRGLIVTRRELDGERP